MTSQARGYNGWSAPEEAKLVEELLIMVNSGLYKADNGFRCGYLQHLEKKIKAALPNSGKLGKPHIESKVRSLKKDWQSVHDMFNGSSTSGFGWDETNKLLTASEDVWNDYMKDNKKDVGKWKKKAFPHYDDLCTVFGNNRARGNEAKDYIDVEKEAVEVPDSDDEVETVMEGNHDAPRKTNVQVKDDTNIEVNETTNVCFKKRKRKSDPLIDGLENVAKLLGDNINKAAATISRDIDFEEDLKKKKSMTTSDIFKMESLTQLEKYQVMEKIRRDIGYVEAYWDMNHEDREGWVKYMLLKD